MSCSDNTCQLDKLVIRQEYSSDSKSRKSIHITSKMPSHSCDLEKKEHYLGMQIQEKDQPKQESQECPVNQRFRMEQQSQPKPSKIEKKSKKRAESLKEKRQPHNDIDNQEKVCNRMSIKGFPASLDLDSFIEQVYSYQLQSQLREARFQFELKTSLFEVKKNEILESIRTKSQNQRSKLFDIKLAFKKMSLAFNGLNDLQTRLLKIKEKELNNDERKLNKIRHECSEALHLTDTIFLKKLQKEQLYKDAKRSGLHTKIFQREFKMQEELFTKCLERYRAYHDRVTALEKMVEYSRQFCKWNEQKKIEQQRIIETEKEICLFEEQILVNQMLRQAEFACIEDQLQDAKKQAQEAKKEAVGLRLYADYFKLMGLDKTNDQMRMQILMKAKEIHQLWQERIATLKRRLGRLEFEDE